MTFFNLKIGKPIDTVTRSDLGLSFIAYPELLATFKYPALFSIIFFLMILNLGLDSGFGGLEAIYSSLADEYKILQNNRKLSMAIIHILLFIFSLPTVTYGGMYVVTFLEFFSTSPALMGIVFFEAFTVCWIYGVNKFKSNIKEMFNINPNLYWIFCWKFAIPIIILVLFFYSIFYFEEPNVDGYKYPKIYIFFGWVINCSIMIPIPINALYQLFKKYRINN